MLEPPLTQLQEVLSQARLVGETGSAEFPPDWAQGRTIFGGLSVASVLEALRRSEPEHPGLRSALIQFIAPVSPGSAELRRRTLRSGASLIQEQLEVLQGGTTRVLVVASYGFTRTSRIQQEGPSQPVSPPRDSVDPLAYQPGLMPTLMRHFEYRITLGKPPISGSETPEIGGWFRLLDPGEVHPEPLAAILVDAWPSPGLTVLRKPAAASTLSWLLHLNPCIQSTKAPDWHLFHARSPRAGEGFVTVESGIWDEAGRCLSLGSQMDVVFG